MARISERKSSFSENYAKWNIDTICGFKSWILCKEPFLTISLTPVFSRCDWCVSGCWGKQIKTGQCSCWTDVVDGGVDVSLDECFCNVSSFSFPNIEYFICCFETQILAISSQNVLEYVDNRMIRARTIHSCNSWHLSGHISLLWKVLCHL